MRAKTPRIVSVDFMRTICILGIICYHCAAHSNSDFKPIFQFANGDWGAVCVMVFFMISGGMLYFNYPVFHNLSEIRTFYCKRWKAIFPAFYLSYIVLFACQVVRKQKLFYNGNPWKLIYSLLGMDGYLHYWDHENYYLIGEWFLGAIIILYMLYPVILFGINKIPILMIIIMIGLYFWMVQGAFFEIPNTQNLISCIGDFSVGILLIKYRSKWDYILTGAISYVFVVILCNWDLKEQINMSYSMQVLSIAFFIALFETGKIIMNYNFSIIFSTISKLSYIMFLWQHLVILFILRRWNPISELGVWIMMLLAIVLTILIAGIVEWGTKKILEISNYEDRNS